jgi:hypothetical protein
VEYIAKKLKYLDNRAEKWLKRGVYILWIILGIEIILELININKL